MSHVLGKAAGKCKLADYLTKKLGPDYQVDWMRTELAKSELPAGWMIAVSKGDKYVGFIDEDERPQTKVLGMSYHEYALDRVKAAL